MVIDLGTGTGQAVLRLARHHPATLVIGIDADAAAMADSSRRAAASMRHGGLANALFLAASADELPGPLAGHASLVTVCLPWGSLLRGLLAPDRDLLTSIAGCLRANGELEILLSATDRDAATSATLANDGDAARLAAEYELVGLKVVKYRPADALDIARLSSGWGRRLGIPERRSAWLYGVVPAPGASLAATTAPGERRGRAPSCTRRAVESACRVSAREC